MANGCVAAIRKGCELYKDVKGTISAAQKTAKEVTAIAEEVGGFFGFFKKKKPTVKPVDAPQVYPTPNNNSLISESTPEVEMTVERPSDSPFECEGCGS